MSKDSKSDKPTEIDDKDLENVQGGARLAQSTITRTTGAHTKTATSNIGGAVSPGDVSYYGSYYGDASKDLGIKTNFSSLKKR